MTDLVVRTTKQLSAKRQIHAAIAHFRAGDFECSITLCSAAEGQMPEPARPIHLFRILQKGAAENPAPNGEKDEFNYAATWMKHEWGTGEVEIDELEVRGWLNRAISKYRAVYGAGTPEMAETFPWAILPLDDDEIG